MPLGSLLIRCFCVVNDCDEPVAVLPNVENYVSLHIVGIFERAANFWKIVPSNLFDENHPCSDLVRGIWMLQHGIVQMLTRNDMATVRTSSVIGIASWISAFSVRAIPASGHRPAFGAE